MLPNVSNSHPLHYIENKGKHTLRWVVWYGMAFHGSAIIGFLYIGARREARGWGYPLHFSIGPKGSLPCLLPQTVMHNPGLFNAIGCQCKEESEKAAIANLGSVGLCRVVTHCKSSDIPKCHQYGTAGIQVYMFVGGMWCSGQCVEPSVKPYVQMPWDWPPPLSDHTTRVTILMW